MYIIRYVKVTFVLSIALFFAIVVLNNLLDYDSNFMFVQHVLSMDTVLPGNNCMGRSIRSPLVHHIFYACITAWESLISFLCFWGSYRLFRSVRAPLIQFNKAKNLAVL